MNKVKVFSECRADTLQDKINSFAKSKKVIEIQYSTAATCADRSAKSVVYVFYTALVVYEED